MTDDNLLSILVEDIVAVGILLIDRSGRKVDIAEATGKDTAGHTAGDVGLDVADLGIVLLGFLIGLEETVDHETPDVTDTLSHIVVIDQVVRVVVVSGHIGGIVGEGSADAVAEWMAGEVELIFPGNCDLVASGGKVGRVGLRRVGTVDARELDTVHEHVDGVSDIDVRGDLEPVLEHAEIQTEVILVRGLPGEG